MPHRPSPSAARPIPRHRHRRRVAGVALALAALLAAGASPATAAERQAHLAMIVPEGRHATAGSLTICRLDWRDVGIYRWDATSSAWVFAQSTPEFGPGCHEVEFDLGTAVPEHAGRYRIGAPGEMPPDASGPGHIEVQVALASPTVTASPEDAVVTAGETASFVAAASVTPGSSSPPARAQWQTSRDGVVWEDVAGATRDAWTMPATWADDDLRVRAVYSRTPLSSFQLAPDEAATGPARLTVWLGVGLERAPRDVEAVAGADATFDVGRVWGVAPVRLQWESAPPGGDFEPVPGATGPSLTLTAGAGPAVDGTRFRLCHANDHSARACSAGASLTVHPAPAPPVVTADPEHVIALPGEPVELAAAATGVDSVRWERRAPGEDWEALVIKLLAVPSSTFRTTTELVATADLHGSEYRAVFVNGTGETPTTTARLTVRVLPPAHVTVSASTRAVDRLAGW